jgi:S-DNA-T family DNA segregation ATPase FtsK/SpoIIIE
MAAIGTASDAASRIELRLTLRGATHDRDIVVDADARSTVSELASALAAHAGVAAPGVLFGDRLGRLRGDASLRTCGLLTGDIVSLTGPVAARTPPSLGAGAPVATLVATGGPSAGLRAGLAPGRFVVGRDAGADVRIADASMSGTHFQVEVDAAGGCEIADLGSSNGTAIEGVGLAAGTAHQLGRSQAIEAGRSTFACEPLRRHDGSAAMTSGATISFNRPPRVSRGYEPPTLRIDAPPAAMRNVRIPILVAIVPVLMGGALYLLTKSPLMLMMAGFSPLMMLGSYVSDKRSGRKEHAEALEQFDAGMTQFKEQLTLSRTEEQAERRAGTPHAGELAARAIDHMPDLWERRPTDRDFLDVRLGVADQPSIVSVSFASGGDPKLRAGVDSAIEAHKSVPVVPVHVRPMDIGAIGIVGDRGPVDGVARWIMLQFATLQSPRDVVITAALSPERADDWGWLAWLPHVDHPASPLEGEHIAIGEQAARDLLRRIASIATERRDEGDNRKRARRRTTIVMLVDEDVAPEAVVVDSLLDGCADVEIAAVWLARRRRNLPGGCNVIVEVSSERAVADVTWTETGRSVKEASADALGPAIAESIARSLAPVEDTTAGGAAASVPRAVSLVDLLGLVDPDPARVIARWRGRSGRTLDAVVGAGSDGPFSLDLRADGPHALVAGTTGAGKSELLQTLIAALAVSHPPDRLAFLLVDYKGGAAFKDCVGLPHSVGMVTDLDEHQVQRALISLNAELKRREHVLHRFDAKDLRELERRDPASAPPSLVIVIDEFATLAKEVPQFVEGVVDVAQRGRSLGVHLVLATQRPGNAVTENIRANTNLRVALRVAGATESDDVIGAPDAARLPKSVPGRALARTGPTELALFQTGYVGGRTRAGDTSRPIEIRDIAPRAPGAALHAASGSGEDEETTDLELLVDAVARATAQLGIEPPPSPWLPALPPAVDLGSVLWASAPGVAAVGVIDEPRLQRQVPLTIDLPATGSLLIFGSSGAGKTSALRTLAASLASTHRPRDLNVYGLDFAGRGLQSIEALPHCGSVVPGEDEERVARLINLLRRAIDARSRLFADRRVASLADHQRLHPDEEMPRIVLLLDSYAGFVETYDRVDVGALVDALPRLVADGRTAGVHFVITADRRSAVPATVASLIAERVILRMASEDDYLMLGLDSKTVKGAVLPPGRGFLDDGREVQVATVAGSTDAAAEATALAALAARLAGATTERAAPIQVLPRDTPATGLPVPTQPWMATFAVDDLDLAPVSASLADSHFVVIGPYRSGRSTALDTIAASLRASTPGLQAHLLTPRRSWLVDSSGWDSVARGLDECEARIGELLDELRSGTGAAAGPAAPVLVVVDDAGELAESHVASSIEMLLKRGRDGHLRFLMSLETGQARHYAAWIREVRKDGRGMLLDPNLDLDGDLLGARLPRRTNAVFPPGRGYVVIDARVALAQVARRGDR